jgi:hypothetical protein
MNVLPLKAENVDPLDQGFHYAYGENIGWSNFKPTAGEGVTITDTQALGYVWSENIGWINLSPDNGGVVNDGIGHLSGWAWGENVGWISFSCRETNSCENIPYGVSVDPATGIFGGYAWGENIGWITFESLSPGIVILQTAWRDNVLPGDINDDTSANILDALIGLQICAGMRPPVVVHLLADINNDSKIGLAEVIHAMQYEAGLRP